MELRESGLYILLSILGFMNAHFVELVIERTHKYFMTAKRY